MSQPASLNVWPPGSSRNVSQTDDALRIQPGSSQTEHNLTAGDIVTRQMENQRNSLLLPSEMLLGSSTASSVTSLASRQSVESRQQGENMVKQKFHL